MFLSKINVYHCETVTSRNVSTLYKSGSAEVLIHETAYLTDKDAINWVFLNLTSLVCEICDDFDVNPSEERPRLCFFEEMRLIDVVQMVEPLLLQTNSIKESVYQKNKKCNTYFENIFTDLCMWDLPPILIKCLMASYPAFPGFLKKKKKHFVYSVSPNDHFLNIKWHAIKFVVSSQKILLKWIGII